MPTQITIHRSEPQKPLVTFSEYIKLEHFYNRPGCFFLRDIKNDLDRVIVTLPHETIELSWIDEIPTNHAT